MYLGLFSKITYKKILEKERWDKTAMLWLTQLQMQGNYYCERQVKGLVSLSLSMPRTRVKAIFHLSLKLTRKVASNIFIQCQLMLESLFQFTCCYFASWFCDIWKRAFEVIADLQGVDSTAGKNK